jgi:predicted Fe-S protein YdhL (DUF1289 family)
MKMIALFSALFFGLFSWPLPSSYADSGRDNRARWQSMSREERQRVIENYRQWKAQSKPQRDNTRRNYEAYRSMPPEERRVLRNRFENYRKLDPSGREIVVQRLRWMDSLSPPEKADVIARYNRIKGRPAGERMRLLEQSPFWQRLDGHDRTIFRRLLVPAGSPRRY